MEPLTYAADRGEVGNLDYTENTIQKAKQKRSRFAINTQCGPSVILKVIYGLYEPSQAEESKKRPSSLD